MDSMMTKKKKNRLAVLSKDKQAKQQNTGGFGMMQPNDCELGLSPGPVNGGKAVFKRNQGKMSPLMNAEKSKFIGIRKK